MDGHRCHLITILWILVCGIFKMTRLHNPIENLEDLHNGIVEGCNVSPAYFERFQHYLRHRLETCYFC